MWKSRLGEVKLPAHGHPASEEQSQNLNSGLTLKPISFCSTPPCAPKELEASQDAFPVLRSSFPWLARNPPHPHWSHLLLTPPFLAGKARDGQREDIQRFDHGRTNLGPRGKGLGGAREVAQGRKGGDEGGSLQTPQGRLWGRDWLWGGRAQRDWEALVSGGGL